MWLNVARLKIFGGKVYENNWQAEYLEKLRNRIKYCLFIVDKSLVQRPSGSIWRRLNYVRRNGLIEQN